MVSPLVEDRTATFKSYIIAIESITAIRKTSVFIKDMELPIGETFREAVEKLVKKGTLVFCILITIIL